MPVDHSLSNQDIQHAQDLVDQGNYSEAWQFLAENGDSYADDAAAVTGDPNNSWDSFDDAFKNSKFSGYIRAGHQIHDPNMMSNQTTSAIGGALSYQTGMFYNFDAGVTFFTTNSISNDDNVGFRFLNKLWCF